MGRYIGENITHEAINEDTTEEYLGQLRGRSWNTIIHCAFNQRPGVTEADLYNYLDDNLLLTLKLAAFQHARFVYLSSVDVYPRSLDPCSETDLPALDAPAGLYATVKRMNESIVKKLCNRPLVLRCAALCGKYSRKNSLIRIAEDDPCDLSLAGESTFNYVLHADVWEFVRTAIEKDLQGVYNIAASDNIALEEVASMLGKKVSFGKFVYETGRIDNSRAAAICRVFGNTSRRNVQRFLRERGQN